MRTKWIGLLAAALLAIGAAAPVMSLAASAATTANATSIGATRATLNGVIDPTYSDSVWGFEYSTSSSFGSDLQHTAPVAVGTGVRAVSVTVTKLAPSTVYFFRVVVASQPDTTLGPNFQVGGTASFTTLAAGTAAPTQRYGVGSLTSRTIKISGSVASVSMHCKGSSGALCTAKIALSARGAGGKTVSCGGGKFIASAPHTHIVRVTLSNGCLSLLKAAASHRLSARFTATFTTHQAKLSQTVGLVS